MLVLLKRESNNSHTIVVVRRHDDDDQKLQQQPKCIHHRDIKEGDDVTSETVVADATIVPLLLLHDLCLFPGLFENCSIS